MSKFCNLHLHTDASLGDSVIKVPDLINKLQEYDEKYVAITDHASTMNHYSLQKACKDTDIKPLFGNECYCKVDFDKPNNNNRYHLVLIAMNELGLKNLRKLQRISVSDHFYRKPLTPHPLIFENAEGLFCSTACSLSYINNCFLNQQDEEAYDFFNKLLDNFGRDNVAVELQYHYQYEEQLFLNEKLIEMYDNTDAKWIINTFDSHFIEDDDRILRKKIQSISWKKNEEDISDSLKSNCLGNDELCYEFGKKCGIDEDIIKLCINNTYKIAEKCYFKPKEYGPIVPEFKFHREFKQIFCKEIY